MDVLLILLIDHHHCPFDIELYHWREELIDHHYSDTEPVYNIDDNIGTVHCVYIL